MQGGVLSNEEVQGEQTVLALWAVISFCLLLQTANINIVLMVCAPACATFASLVTPVLIPVEVIPVQVPARRLRPGLQCNVSQHLVVQALFFVLTIGLALLAAGPNHPQAVKVRAL